MKEHPISAEKARELMAGDLGDVYRKILADCCVPIFWCQRNGEHVNIAHNGTLTIVRTPKEIIGVTAAHVVRQFEQDIKTGSFQLNLMNEIVNDLLDRVICISDKLDIATISLGEQLTQKLGKVPLGMWPPRLPEVGRGIMIAGFPGIERLQPEPLKISWGLFTALGIARTVSQQQITWLVEPEHHIPNPKIPTPPPQYPLGGISGGPLISWFESEAHVVHFRLSGIVIEHPDYSENTDFPPIERLVAVCADSITEDGRIIEFATSA